MIMSFMNWLQACNALEEAWKQFAVNLEGMSEETLNLPITYWLEARGTYWRVAF